MNSSRQIIIVLTLTHLVFSAKILGIFPIPSSSHRNLYAPLMNELTFRGHDVTVITPFEENSDGSFKTVLLTGFAEYMKEMMKNMKVYETVENHPIEKVQFSGTMMIQICEKTLSNENVKKLIHSKEKFDLVISAEVLTHAFKALAPYFEAPLISFSTIGSSSWTNLIVGNPAPPSYVPDLFSSYSGQMTFFQRLSNAFILLFTQIYLDQYINPKNDELIKKYIPGEFQFEQVLYNVSLVLLNSHPSINQAVPHVPNMIEIGGFHIKPPKKLPQDLQEYLDDAPDGVIYFSMGSNLKSSELPKEKREAFLRTFSKLKQKVLWKWEDDNLPGKPSNVKISKWLPQQDILAHRNIKLFITHGGLLSTTETVYHGIPVLAIPIFGDQKLNAKIAVEHGFGLSLSFEEVNENSLTKTIDELLKNPKYKNNAKLRSSYFHDRPRKPMETAMYWIEYVIRHKGAPHLRVAALDLPWYKYFLLDVIAVIAASLLIGIKIACFILRKICGRFCKMKTETKVKKN